MSAYVVDKTTIDAIVSTGIVYGLVDPVFADDVGQRLWDANAESVGYRYPQDLTAARALVVDYTYWPTPAVIGERARAVTNYCYQACEHPMWEHSTARELCLRIAVAMLVHIPGYNDAVTR